MKNNERRKGQTLVEYILTAIFVAITLIVSLTFLGNRLAPFLGGIHIPSGMHGQE
jgi:Flp pilus assembly pilin Flp